MKTKPITLILTLLICLSGSVLAEEDEKEGKKIKKEDNNELKSFEELKEKDFFLYNSKLHYRPLVQLYSLEIRYKKSYREIGEIINQLAELVDNSESQNQNDIDLKYLDHLHNRFDNVLDALAGCIICLEYEKVLLQNKTNKKLLIKTHSQQRSKAFASLFTYTTELKTLTKKHRIKIQNTTAVIAINEHLKLFTELHEWAAKNKYSPL